MTGSSVGELAVIESAPKVQGPVVGDGLIARTGLLGRLAAIPERRPARSADRAGRLREDDCAEPMVGRGWPGVRLGHRRRGRRGSGSARRPHRPCAAPHRAAGPGGVPRSRRSGTGHGTSSRCRTCSRHCGTGPTGRAGARRRPPAAQRRSGELHPRACRRPPAGLPHRGRVPAGALASADCAARAGASSSARTTWRSRRRRHGQSSSRRVSTAPTRLAGSGPAHGGLAGGVYLAALAIRAGPDAAGAAGGIAGDDPFIVDYFRDELLARESPDTVRFLLRTAVLGQMCGSLCDHVLGGSGSAGRLADAARRNLFVVPLDRRGEWYRYHRLLAEMLLSELRRREPGEELRVHRRAAAWYEERGLPEQAIAHAIAGRDTLDRGQAGQPACPGVLRRRPASARSADGWTPWTTTGSPATRRWRSPRPGSLRSTGTRSARSSASTRRNAALSTARCPTAAPRSPPPSPSCVRSWERWESTGCSSTPPRPWTSSNRAALGTRPRWRRSASRTR